jgi:hypothetical protein
MSLYLGWDRVGSRETIAPYRRESARSAGGSTTEMGIGMPAEAIGAMVCSLLVGLALGTLIGAIILRAAVSLYNKIFGGSSLSGVPEPDFGKAMGITFLTTLIQLVVRFLLGIAGSAVAQGAGPNGKIVALGTSLLAIPVSFLVMAGLIAAMLPTTFPRALLVALFYMIIGILIVAVLVVALIAAGVGTGMLGK